MSRLGKSGRVLVVLMLVSGLVFAAAPGALADPGDPAPGFTPQTLEAALGNADVAVDASGRIYVAAIDTSTTPDALVVRRYLSTGALDASWATAGEFSYSFEDLQNGGPTDAHDVIDIRVAGDGFVFVGVEAGPHSRHRVVKLDVSGALALDFGDGGGPGDGEASVFICYGPAGMDLDVLSGDVWIAATADGDCSGTTFAKLDKDDGAVLLHEQPSALFDFFAYDQVAHPLGGIALFGAADGATAIARVSGGGNMVNSFGGDGVVQVGPWPWALIYLSEGIALHVDDQGRFTGALYQSGTTSCDAGGCTFKLDSMSVVRTLASGAVDNAFGTSGVVLLDLSIEDYVPFGSGSSSIHEMNLAVDADRRVLVSHRMPGAPPVGGVTVIRADGVVDTSWADAGQLEIADAVTGLEVTGDYVLTVDENSVGHLKAWRLPTGVPPAASCNGVPATIVGSSGDDVLTGTSGNDVIHGLGGNDIINGAGGSDLICGGNGNDIIQGKAGNDKMYGGLGNDKLNGGPGNDVLSGGLGKDTAVYFGASAGVTVDLAAGTGGGANQGADTIIGVEHVMGSLFGDVLRGNAAGNRLKGLTGADQLVGLGGADTLIGAGNNDMVYGGGGNDVLQGKAGADRLFGGPGNDTLEGNVGNDKLYGGDGVDVLNGGAGNADACYDGETYVSCELPL